MKLSEQDIALSPHEKMNRAVDIVLDEEYYSQKNDIRNAMASSLLEIEKMTHKTEDVALNNIQKLLSFEYFVDIFQILVVFIVIWLSVRYGVNPTLKAVERIRSDRPIDEIGSSEFLYLARAYNSLTIQLSEGSAKLKEAGLLDALTGIRNRIALKVDYELQRVARIKAQDMVDNNYFDHNSPTYGTPFNMMKSFGISYKTAGENIAGNSSNSATVTAWMNSTGHRANILNSSYNYTGLAVVSSPKYGKIYVQMFIGK